MKTDEKMSVRKGQFILRFVLFSVAFAVIAICTGAFILFFYDNTQEESDSVWKSSDSMIIIDAGHGGEDGGASSKSGLLEKDLNLLIAENLHQMCCFCGIPSEMTREDDVLLYDKFGELSDYTGHKKSYDLKNRVRFAKEACGTLFISIHMNTFPQEKYSGTQVYYSPNCDQSREFAKMLRDSVRESLQPDNNREIKRAGKNIYILDRLTVPAVLIECGFLSNEEETQKLSDSSYRRDLAACFFSVLSQYESTSES